MADLRTIEAVESSDTDELLRIIDGHCQSRSWEAIIELRTMLSDALTRGKQLWGVDQHIRYRLALEAPPPLSAAAVVEGPARFALGPLTEVAANRHSFADLEPHLPACPERTLIAHERVLAGERIDASQIDPTILELPLALMAWEPEYLRPEYQAHRVESHPPALPTLSESSLPAEAELIDDPDTVTALMGLVTPWIEESNGRGQAVCAGGSVESAIRAFGLRRARIAAIEAKTALTWMAWAGASGGAMGRRRGGAAGRFATWWALSALAGSTWPAPPDELGRSSARMHWFAWSDLAPATGWALNLAVADPQEGLSWAIGVIDAV
jgi:hypothetical protein